MSAPRWYIARNKEKVGPFSGSDIKQLATHGLLQPGEFLWAEGSSKWVEATSIPGLFPPSGQTRHWLQVAGRTRGPFVADQVRAGLTTKQFNLETQSCVDGSTEWLPLGKVTEFRDFVPVAVSPSRAQLLIGSLDLEEAALHLAGKSGDVLAKLISNLIDLKRAHGRNPALVESLDATIKTLQARRDEQASVPVPTPPRMP
jgi:hypothetical protein